MNDSNQLPVGGDGYQRILSASPRDARIYLWSERLVMIAGIGSLIALGFAILWPLFELMRGSWRGLGHYFGGIIVLPLPFFAVLFAGVWLHRRVARRHGL
jgi:hypothetical protein